jgi:pimeloyl-ACP methyl ester carboxylesterase
MTRQWGILSVPTIDANGLKLAYEEQGDRGAPVILLVMGLGVNLLLWPDELCERLAAAGFRVIRFDNRDVGLSTRLDHLGTPRVALEAVKYALHLPVRAPYLIDDMARDAAALLDALGVARAHVVGASMGGMIAQNLAANAPRKVASLVSIMSTTGRRSLPPPAPRAMGALLAPPARAGDIEGAILRMMRLLRVIGSRTYPAGEGYLRALCERHMRRGYHPAGAARQLLAIAASGDRTRVVQGIRAPALVLHGDEDPLLKPPCGEATARAITEGGGHAAFEVVRGMGHDLPVELMPRIAESIASHCRRAA